MIRGYISSGVDLGQIFNAGFFDHVPQAGKGHIAFPTLDIALMVDFLDAFIAVILVGFLMDQTFQGQAITRERDLQRDSPARSRLRARHWAAGCKIRPI